MRKKNTHQQCLLPLYRALNVLSRNVNQCQIVKAQLEFKQNKIKLTLYIYNNNNKRMKGKGWNGIAWNGNLQVDVYVCDCIENWKWRGLSRKEASCAPFACFHVRVLLSGFRVVPFVLSFVFSLNFSFLLSTPIFSTSHFLYFPFSLTRCVILFIYSFIL